MDKNLCEETKSSMMDIIGEADLTDEQEVFLISAIGLKCLLCSNLDVLLLLLCTGNAPFRNGDMVEMVAEATLKSVPKERAVRLLEMMQDPEKHVKRIGERLLDSEVVEGELEIEELD